MQLTKIVFTSFAHMLSGGGLRETSVTRFFPKPVRRDQKRVSHERFNWPKKVLSDESPSSMHSSGSLLYHDSSPFVPTEFSFLAGLIDGAVYAM
jgi:hypothetical protein